MPPSTAEVQKKCTLRPGYFVVRKTGEVVPLIAVDELPPGIDLVGVPRCIVDLEEAVGMHNLGLQRRSGAFYQLIQGGEDNAQSKETVGKADKITSIPTPTTTPPKSAQGSATAAPSIVTCTPKAPTTTAAARTIANAGLSRLPQTNLCRHWCATGFCKWGERCRWRHIMPTSLHGLKEVGLVDWPDWFRKQNPGYFVSDARSGRGGNGSGGGPSSRLNRGRKHGDHGGDCCGPVQTHLVNGGRGERVRVNGSATVRERESGRFIRNEELGEQIVARLRAMSKEGKVVREKVVAGANRGEGTEMVERATKKDTRKWEDDEGEDESEEEIVEAVAEEKGHRVATNGKLVDV